MGGWCQAPAESSTDDDDPCVETARSRCRGTRGTGHENCMERQHIECCVGLGGTRAECCADKSLEVQTRYGCQAQTENSGNDACTNAAASHCQSMEGADHLDCMEEENIKCCVGIGGTRSECCADRGP